MSKPIIVAIAGTAGAGKSTIAERLRDHHGFAIVGFADPLKRIAGDLFGFTDRQLYGPSCARSEPHLTLRRPDGEPLTARFALEKLGTDFARSCCPNIWIDLAQREWRKHRRVAIPDARFRNELETVKAMGGRLIKRTTTVPPASNHPSEVEHLELPDSYFDAVLPQYATKAELYAHVDALVKDWTDEARGVSQARTGTPSEGGDADTIRD